MNLKKFRDDQITDKLLNYRINGVNYFMDQDAFNYVIGNKVMYYPPYYFTLYFKLTYKKFSLYGENNKRDVIKKTLIMHFAYKKPWKVKMPNMTKQYLYYHSQSPFSDVKLNPRSYTKQFYKRIKRLLTKR